MLTQNGIDALLSTSAEAGSSPTLQILGVYRLALDPTWLAATHETIRPECGDAYDIVLSDGVHKLKCVLSTALNARIYRGWMRLHSVVRVAGWRRLMDERLLGGSSQPVVVVISDLKAVRFPADGAGTEEPAYARVFAGGVIAASTDLSDDVPEVTFHASAQRGGDQHTTDEAPLLGKRRHYLRLDSDDVLLTERWTARTAEEAQQAAADEDDEDAQELPSIEAVPELARAKVSLTDEAAPRFESAPSRVLADGAPQGARLGRASSKKDIPPLVGRVTRLGPLKFFGGLHERSTQRYATSFTFWLCDATGELPVTVWNRKCEELYASLGRAQLVLVRGYRLGLWRTGFDEGQAEWRANVNTSNPTGSVRLLDDGMLADAWGDEVCARRIPIRMPPVSAATRAGLLRSAADLAAAAEERAAAAARLRLLDDEDADGADKVGDAATTWGYEPDVLAEARTPLVDLACVIVRAFAPFRMRISASQRRNVPRFVRARWLLVLLGEGGPPLPMLVYAHHVPPKAHTTALFPSDSGGALAAAPPLSLGRPRPVLIRHVAVGEGGEMLGGGGGVAGSSAADAVRAPAAPRQPVLRSAPGTHVLEFGEDALLPEGLECEGLDDLCVAWSDRLKELWAPACRVDASPPALRSPAGLGELCFTSLPPLPALRSASSGPALGGVRLQRLFSELAAAMAALHVNELAAVLVLANIGPEVSFAACSPAPLAAREPWS